MSGENFRRETMRLFFLIKGDTLEARKTWAKWEEDAANIYKEWIGSPQTTADLEIYQARIRYALKQRDGMPV